MFNIFNNVAPSYMCDINLISHRHNTRQSDSAYVVPRVKGQGSKSFKFNGSKSSVEWTSSEREKCISKKTI